MFFQLLKTKFKRSIQNSLIFSLPKVQVKVNQGIVEGVLESLPDGRKFQRFSGIPYAKTPINELRFRSPKKLLKFDRDVVDCTREGDVCYHRSVVWSTFVGSEDCLNLNVYAPVDVDNSRKFAVMVFIHGGSFLFDSGNRDFYSPEYLLMEDVIVVTLNYRLHFLGFSSIPSLGIHGNSGLKDQQMALEWVSENIENFGGNKDNVTLFGESSGAACAHLHGLNKKSQQYFHKMILQSGTALNDWVLQRDGVEKTKRLAQSSTRMNVDTPEDIYKVMMMASDLKKMILKSYRIQDSDERRRGFPVTMKPTIEAEHDDAFLTQLPIDLIKSSTYSMPMIIGYNKYDGSVPSVNYRHRLNYYSEDLIKFIPFSLSLEPESESAEKLSHKITKFYFGTKDNIKPENFEKLMMLKTDTYFFNPMMLAVELNKKFHPECRQYVYEFNLDSRLNLMKNLMKLTDISGAMHFDDVGYLFDQQISGLKFDVNSKEYLNRKMMCKMWTNFAKFTDPTPAESEHNPLNVRWDSVEVKENSKINYLKIHNNNVSMDENLNSERLDFWKKIYEEYNGSYLNPQYIYKKT